MLIEVKPDLSYLLEADYLYLSLLSKIAPDGDAVEIGSASGGSTVAIARTGRKLHAVDLMFKNKDHFNYSKWISNVELVKETILPGEFIVRRDMKDRRSLRIKNQTARR